MGLVEKNSGVSTGDDFTALGEPSGIIQGIESFGDVNPVDVELFAVFIDNGKELSIDIKFQNSGNGEISRNLPEVRVNSGVHGKEIEIELACINIVNNDENKVRKNGSLGCDFLDDDVVLLGIDENDWIGALETKLERLKVFVEDFDLDLAVLVEYCGFVEVIGVNGDKNSFFVLGTLPKMIYRACSFQTHVGFG